MVNRNAARHLLLIVSILLFAFIYLGYRLRNRGGEEGTAVSVPVAVAAPAAAPQQPAAGLALRPPGSDTQTPTVGDDDLAGWVPSARGEELSLAPPVNLAPPGTPLSPEPTQQAGVITGLVPSPVVGLRPDNTPAASGSAGAPVLLVPDDTTSVAFDSDGDDDAFFSLPLGDGDVGDGDDAPAFAEAPSSSPTSSTPGPSTPVSGGISLAPPPVGLTPPGTASTPPPGGLLAPPPPSPSSAQSDARSASPMASTATRLAPPPAPAPEAAGDTRPVATASSGRPPPPPPATPSRPDTAEWRETPEATGQASESLRIYVVRSGDTLSSIALRELGSGSMADNIFLLNRDVIDDPDHLMVGVKIRLPYANRGIDGDSGSLPVDVSGRRPTQGLGRSHIVVRGDTLSSIALQYYGSSAGWSFIYESNRHMLPNPNQLTVGMELTIPPFEGQN